MIGKCRLHQIEIGHRSVERLRSAHEHKQIEAVEETRDDIIEKRTAGRRLGRRWYWQSRCKEIADRIHHPPTEPVIRAADGDNASRDVYCDVRDLREIIIEMKAILAGQEIRNKWHKSPPDVEALLRGRCRRSNDCQQVTNPTQRPQP